MKKNLSTLLLLFFFSISFVHAFQNEPEIDKLIKKIKQTSHEAFLSNDEKLYKQSIGMCERLLSAYPQNILAKYYLAYNEYRLLMTFEEENDLFDKYFNDAMRYAKEVRNQESFESEANTLIAAINMIKLSRNQSNAPVIAQKIYDLLSVANEHDSLNPRAYLIKGIMLFNTPKMFGGSKQKAINNFNKALKIFEMNFHKEINWGNLESLAWKGQALVKLNKLNKAKELYLEALQIEPKFSWVKNKLLPGLEDAENNLSTQTELKKDTTATLSILIKGLSNNEGYVRIAISNSEENFEADNFFKRTFVKIKNKTAHCTFEDIPYGTYAIKFYHDENNNRELDKNLFGMPTEDYGFSNNATGSFGPASFGDAKFEVNKNKLIIEMLAQ